MIATKNNLESINVFLIGNNPIELSNIYEKLKEIRNKTYRAEIGFDLRGLFNKIMRFNPACILIDDNMERTYLNQLMASLSSSEKTRNIPVTILKNSNRDSHYAQAEDYLLKEAVTCDLLSTSITNSIRLKKVRNNVAMFYGKKKKQLREWIS